jgi:acyl dehydratase
VYKFHYSSERKLSPFCVTLPNPLNEHPWLRVSVRGNAGYESYCPHTLPHLVYSGKRKLHIRILPNFEQSNISVRYTTVSNHTNNATIDHRSPRHQDPLLVNHLILQCLPHHILQRRPRSRGTDLSLVYESHPNFHALPTFGAVPDVAVMDLVHRAMHDFLPDFQDNNHVHGKHYLRLVRPYPIPQGTDEVQLNTTANIVDIVDRKRGVLVCVDIITTTEAGHVVCENEWVGFVMNVPTAGANPKQIPRGVRTTLHATPTRQPDEVLYHKTSTEQGAPYRATSGDLNPLHINPGTVAAAGLAAPILTGTCTLGIGVRHVTEALCAGDASRFRSVKVRLSKPVFAALGEEVRTEMWEESKDGGRRMLFRTIVDGGDAEEKFVMSHGCVELTGEEALVIAIYICSWSS